MKCNMKGELQPIIDNYIVYSGSDSFNANIYDELIMQETYQRNCEYPFF